MSQQQELTQRLGRARRRLFQDDEGRGDEELNGVNEINGINGINGVNGHADPDNADRDADQELRVAVLEEAHWENVQNRLLESIQESRAAARDKWNFDFETETPLEGSWEWERVTPNETASAPAEDANGRNVQQPNAESPTK